VQKLIALFLGASLAISACCLAGCSGDSSGGGPGDDAGGSSDSTTGPDSTIDAPDAAPGIDADASTSAEAGDSGELSDAGDSAWDAVEGGWIDAADSGSSDTGVAPSDAGDATLADAGDGSSEMHDAGTDASHEGVDASDAGSGDAASPDASDDGGSDAPSEAADAGDDGSTASDGGDAGSEGAAPEGGGSEAGTDAMGPAWVGEDIGPVGVAGSWCFGGNCVPAVADGTFALTGSGADLGLCGGVSCGHGTNDELYFVHQTVSGDATITARVVSIQRVVDWSKALITMRDGLGDDATFVSISVPADGTLGYYWFYRPSAGGSLAFPQPAVPGGTPVWLRIVRRGDVFTGTYSADGVLWQQLASMTITMSTSLEVGLGVVSRDNTQLATGVFDSVSVTMP
jgi:hypothetical protein